MIDFKSKKYFLLDLDGTLYAGSQLFSYTVEFLRTLRNTGRKPVFLTNNSSKSTEEYFRKLKGLGIAQKKEEIYTSGEATIDFLRDKGIKRIFLLAPPSVEKEFEGAGFCLVNPGPDSQNRNGLNKTKKDTKSLHVHSKVQQNIKTVKCRADSELLPESLRAQRLRQQKPVSGKHANGIKRLPQAVILAFDTTFTYEKFCLAHDLITAGVPFYATHPDNHVPLENGIMHPDIGTFISAFRTSTGVAPFVIGKPEKHIYEQLRTRLDCGKEAMVMVGDRLNTDILGANNYGLDSILVLSGETTRAMLNKAVKGQKPTSFVENVGGLLRFLR